MALQEPRPSLLLPLPLGLRHPGRRRQDQRHPGPHLRLAQGLAAAAVITQRRMARAVTDLRRMARAVTDLRRMAQAVTDLQQMALADMGQARMETMELRLAEAAGLSTDRQNMAWGQAIFTILPPQYSMAVPAPEAVMSGLVEAAARFARGPTAEFAMCTTADAAWIFIMD